MKKIFILISVILLFKPYSVYSMDYDKLEIICKNKGLTVDKKEYWECMDEQRKLKNTYNPNTKTKISDNNSNTSSNNRSYRSSSIDKYPIITNNKTRNNNKKDIKPKKIINYFR